MTKAMAGRSQACPFTLQTALYLEKRNLLTFSGYWDTALQLDTASQWS